MTSLNTNPSRPLRYRILLLSAISVCACLPWTNVRAQDEDDDGPALELPKDGSTPNYWVLKFKPESLRMITLRDGPTKGRVYWYLVYTLQNPADEDRQVYLSITASSDRKKIYGDVFLPTVERAIEKKERMLLWGKADEFSILAKRKPSDPGYNYLTVKAGAKRKSVAIFNRLDPNANQIVIKVSGLSNEVRRVTDAEGNGFLEERLRELHYRRPGDEYAVTRDSFALKKETWVRRRVKQVAGSDEG